MNPNLPTKLQNFFTYLEQEIAPHAAVLDQDSNALKQAYEAMLEKQMFGAAVPQKFGGLELNNTEAYYFYRNLTCASAALNLLQAQYQGVLKMITAFASEEFKAQWLPPACRGEIKFAHAVAQLHHPHLKAVSAQREGEYFKINGQARYVTGFGFADHVALGFIVDDKEYMAIAPFKQQPGMCVHEPLDLIAAKSTNTVTVDLENYLIPVGNIFYEKPVSFFQSISIHGHHFASMTAGIALAILKLIATAPLFKEAHVQHAYQCLSIRFAAYEQQVLQLQAQDLTAPTRAKGIVLTKDCLLLAEQLFRGAAAQKDHPLNRLKNEAQLFSALGAEKELLGAMCEVVSSC